MIFVVGFGFCPKIKRDSTHDKRNQHQRSRQIKLSKYQAMCRRKGNQQDTDRQH
ncbi:Uncharacterised protein [Vibrio cholerae]|nr:Uncharacterised protein [Vibrio cholerae]